MSSYVLLFVTICFVVCHHTFCCLWVIAVKFLSSMRAWWNAEMMKFDEPIVTHTEDFWYLRYGQCNIEHPVAFHSCHLTTTVSKVIVLICALLAHPSLPFLPPPSLPSPPPLCLVHVEVSSLLHRLNSTWLHYWLKSCHTCAHEGFITFYIT